MVSFETDQTISDTYDSEFLQNRKSTQILINGASILDEADTELLPAVYAPMSKELGFSLVQLGLITAIRALLQSLSTPVWGWFSDKYSRKKILASGCLLWGVFTILMCMSDTFVDILFFRAMVGIGLAVIVPTAQSLITDYFYENERGVAFGWLGLTAVVGAIVGTLFATAFGGDIWFGIAGWRFVFLVFGIISLLLCLVVWHYVQDPYRGNAEKELHGMMNEKIEKNYPIRLSDYKRIITNKTFILIIIQGIAGTIPYNALLFAINYFEDIGFSSIVSGIIFAVIAVSTAIGTLFGGWIGDKAEQWNPDKGRILMAQISVFSGIPVMILFFWILPHTMTAFTIVLYLIVGIVAGFMINWSATACNYPMYSEIFEPELRSTIFSLDNFFGGSIGATGTFLVALLAQYIFGYITLPQGVDINQVSNALRIKEVVALGNALVVSTTIPWIICLFIYIFVYWTYPKDRDRMKNVLLERKEDILSGNNVETI